MKEAVDVEFLFRQYYEPLYRYALVLCGSVSEAEDAVQNTFVRAMRGQQAFRGDATPKTWLYTIARNECLRLLANRRHESIPLSEEPECTVCIEETVCTHEAVRIVMEYISACEEPRRSLIALRLLGERSFREIAMILGKSDTWCRVTFMRSKNDLIRRLEGLV